MTGPIGEAATRTSAAPSRPARSVAERIEQTRAACLDALAAPELAPADTFLVRRGLADDAGFELLRVAARRQQATPELLALRDALAAESGVPAEAAALERTLLLRAALAAIPRLSGLPVDDSVKHLLCKEFAFFANPPAAGRARFALTASPFFAMGRVALLERFPAGSSHWEVSGFPRSWLLKVQAPYRAATYRFLALHARGFRPFFVAHLAGTRQSLPMLIEREFRLGFYRAATALEMQPEIKGMMAGSWLHSLETHRVSPHLAFLNRPYLEAGGIYTDIGPAEPSDGFLAGSPERTELYRTGRYRPTFGVVLCTRAQAIAWKRAHPELEALTAAVR